MTSREECAALDRADPLLPFRARFALPEDVLYLDGNSLGALPKATLARMREVVENEWGMQLIRGWDACGWVEAGERVGGKIGYLIGAAPGETLAGDSTSINLFKALGAALALRPGRDVILSEAGNFPTDLYIAEGLAALLGGNHRLLALEANDMEDAIDESVAVVMLTHVNYRTGRRWNMRRITECAHAAGALMLWDLAHSAGAVPLAVAADGADFGVGCGYKYLNGGPGAPGFLYVARRHQQASVPLTGWFGHARPFAFERGYAPAPGISRFAVGTPSVLGLAALESGLDLLLQADLCAVWEKSERQTRFFMELVGAMPASFGLSIVTPFEEAERGSQVCVQHPHASLIMQALIAQGVIGDFRAPDILRFGFAPLYVRYTEVYDAAAALRRIMEHKA